jgi:multidrug efflux pump
MNTGILRKIPLSAVAKIDYINSYGQINRLNLKRVITLSSNVLDGYNANEINMQLRRSSRQFAEKTNVDIRITGEQEEQEESMIFLSKAMLIINFPGHVHSDHTIQFNVKTLIISLKSSSALSVFCWVI